MDKILLFIPCYNCEKQIARVLSQFDENIIKYISEILIVNNCSTDNTEQAVINFSKENQLPLKILRNHENYNLGGSHKVAFNYAIENNFDYVIVLHGDDQADIHDILPILESKSYKNYDCCLGSRFMKGSKTTGYSKIRIIGNIIYNIIFSIATLTIIRDLGSGLNMYNIKMLKNKFYLKFSDTLMFNYYMILASTYYKFGIIFFPITWREIDQTSNVKMFWQAIKTLEIVIKYLISNKKNYINSDFRDKYINEYKTNEVFKEG